MQELFSWIESLFAAESPLSATSAIFTIIMFVDWLKNKLSNIKKK